MMTAIDMLQNEREMMGVAERKIRDSLINESPGVAASSILQDYINLSSDAERMAFVTVLASRLAIRTIILSASI